MQVDLGGKLVVFQEIAPTNLRPDIVLWSRSRMRIYIVKEVSDEAVKSSQWIWIRRSNSGLSQGGVALRVNRLLEEARKKFRMYLSGGCGPCEPFETRWPFQVSWPV